MSELIPLTNTDDGVQAVMGRDLHAFLEVQSNYREWFPRMVAYGFEQGKDYASKNRRVQDSLGREREATDHIVTLDMAKEISMIQRTDKGKQARRYFIECERRAQQPQFELPQDYVSALRELASTVEERDLAEKRARELEAPAKSWATMAAAGGDYSVSAAAKTLSRDPNISIGRDQLFTFMSEKKWIFRAKGRRKHWEAYQDKGMNAGRLTHKLSRPFLNEKTGEWEQPDPTVRVTPKGLHELHKLLGGSKQIELVS
nr:MAG TPA: antirepressor protein [Caudoviricetes sp.]